MRVHGFFDFVLTAEAVFGYAPEIARQTWQRLMQAHLHCKFSEAEATKRSLTIGQLTELAKQSPELFRNLPGVHQQLLDDVLKELTETPLS